MDCETITTIWFDSLFSMGYFELHPRGSQNNEAFSSNCRIYQFYFVKVKSHI